MGCLGAAPIPLPVGCHQAPPASHDILLGLGGGAPRVGTASPTPPPRTPKSRGAPAPSGETEARGGGAACQPSSILWSYGGVGALLASPPPHPSVSQPPKIPPPGPAELQDVALPPSTPGDRYSSSHPSPPHPTPRCPPKIRITLWRRQNPLPPSDPASTDPKSPRSTPKRAEPHGKPRPMPPPGCSPRPPRKNSGGRRLYRGPIGPHGAALFLAEVKGSATSARAFFHSHLRLYNLGFLSRFRRFSNLPRFFFIYFFIFYFRRALRVPARVPAPTSVRIRHPQPRCLGKGQEQPPPGIGVPE